MEYNFTKVHTAKDFSISTIILFVGIGLFFVNKGLGICVAVCGLLLFLLYKGGYKMNGQDVVLTKKSEDICKVCKSSLVDFLGGKDVTLSVRKGNEGGSVRLDVYYNKTGSIAYAQLFDFCNYAYEPVTGIVELKGNRADKLIASIQ